jgi:peroxiredoxin
MSWYIFEDGRQNRPAPDFKLVAPSGDELDLMAYRNRANLVMVFLHAEDCDVCEAMAGQLAEVGQDIFDRDARLALIYPSNGKPHLFQVPSDGTMVISLADPGGKARRAYQEMVPDARGTDVLTVVLDRYSAPYAALSADEPDLSDHPRQILEWLDYIEVQCPE